MLFFMLVERLRAGQSTYFQTHDILLLFEAGRPVCKVKGSVYPVPGEDIWALVDGNVVDGRPRGGLLRQSNVRIVMASSPRSKGWLKQKKSAGVLFMKTWTEQELFFAGCVLLFLLLMGQPES
jgi:hypothetical protein